jgi:hypothetical protein
VWPPSVCTNVVQGPGDLPIAGIWKVLGMAGVCAVREQIYRALLVAGGKLQCHTQGGQRSRVIGQHRVRRLRRICGLRGCFAHASVGVVRSLGTPPTARASLPGPPPSPRKLFECVCPVSQLRRKHWQQGFCRLAHIFRRWGSVKGSSRVFVPGYLRVHAGTLGGG